MKIKIPVQPIKLLHPDPRWTFISPFSSYAPVIVISLFGLCMIQIVLGAVWISKLGGNLQFALVLQPLILPCLSLFNTVPSLHLHLYSRTNNPLLSLWSNVIFAILYLTSAIVSLVACATTPPYIGGECPVGRSGRGDGDATGTGPNISNAFWNTVIALWMLSFAGYAVLSVMACIVWIGLRRKEREGSGWGPEHHTNHPNGSGEMEDEVIGDGNGTGDGGNGNDNEDRRQRTRATPPPARLRGIGEGRFVRDWEQEMMTQEQREENLRRAEEKWRALKVMPG